MKTINDINKKMAEAHKLLVESSKIDTKKAKNICKRLNKQLRFLKLIKTYLESNPRPEFVQSELETITMRIGRIDEGYLVWAAGRAITSYKDPKKAYTNEMGLPQLKEQMKTLKYILK